MIKLRGNLQSVEERTKFNNTRMFDLDELIILEQLVYGLIFSDPSTLEGRAFLITAGVSFVYVVLTVIIYLHNKRYDHAVKENVEGVKGYFVVKGVIQYFYLVFLLATAIFRAVYVSPFHFTIPVIYIAVLYGISFLFYYPPVWTATLYIVTSISFILLSKSQSADFLYDNFIQDVMVNNILAWLGSLLSYRRFAKQVEALDTIQAVNKDKDDLIHMRETIIDISGKVALEHNSDELYQYILEKCLTLVPNAVFGSILMFKENGLLGIRAHVGFNDDEIDGFELPLEESFLYVETKGAMDQTIIINRIRGVLNDEKMVGAGEVEFPVKSEIASPLILDGELVGIVGIDGDHEDAFSEKDVYVIDYMTKQVAQVIRQQMLYDEVLKLSQYDSLTNLYNRNTFDTKVEQDLENAKKEETVAYFAIADLDGLKQVNDAYGHAVGDDMIRIFSKTFCEYMKPIGFCARYGGDEFVFYTSESNEMNIMNQVMQVKNYLKGNPIKVKDKEFFVEFSYGMCSTKEVGYSEELLYNHADKKMYEDKNGKKS